MRLKAIQQEFYNVLEAIYQKEEIDAFFFLLTESYFGVKRIDLAMDTGLSIENSKSIFDALKELKQEKPIQYILGETNFFGLPFKVNSSVLIPRPETEELVSWILDNIDKKEDINILDIGTGSGCIATSLAKKTQKASVFALDVSLHALAVAKANARLNEVDVKFIEADILKVSDTEFVSKLPIESLKFDIIVSNPPYVRELEKSQMKPNVLENEPHLALFVKNDNALLFYEAISKFAKTFLKENGELFFEINEYLGKETTDVLKQYGFKNVELKKDIFEKDRMIKAMMPNGRH